MADEINNMISNDLQHDCHAVLPF